MGFRDWFNKYLREPPYVEKEILVKLKEVAVHICPEEHHALPYPKLGLACKENHIWVFGQVEDGQIVSNHHVLGHELTHLLHYENNEVANPDA